jgi:hypothetical protein
LILVGIFAGLLAVHVTLFDDFTIVDAVADPAIHCPPPHAIACVPAVEYGSVQLMPSKDVMTPFFAAPAHIRPFHATISIGREAADRLVEEDADQVNVGFAAY